MLISLCLAILVSQDENVQRETTTDFFATFQSVYSSGLFGDLHHHHICFYENYNVISLLRDFFYEHGYGRQMPAMFFL